MAGLASGLFVVRIRTDRGDRVVRVVLDNQGRFNVNGTVCAGTWWTRAV